MKVSIAMCTYNGDDFLREQLESFSRQTRLPDELIVCDDGSQDTTREILVDFANSALFPVELHFNEKNVGFIKNFEKATSLCSGDIIFLSDQDDVWHEEKLQLFTEVFATDESVGIVFCDAELVDEKLISLNKSAWESRRFDRKKQKQFTQPGNRLEIILRDNVISGCMMAFRSKFKETILPIPSDIVGIIHDYWIAILLAIETKPRVLPLKLVKYRQHARQQLGLSVTTKTSSLAIQATERFDFKKDLLKYEGLKKNILKKLKQQPYKSNDGWRILLQEIDKQSAHFRSRTAISNEKNQRLQRILSELLSMRYHKYSNGWRSAVKDLSLYFTKH